MTELNFTVHGKPIPQGSMTNFGRGRLVHKPELIAWRNKVLNEAKRVAKEADWPLNYDGPVRLSATFYLPKPQRPRWMLPAVKPDLDKLVRAIGDALSPRQGTGILKEDSRIVEVSAVKVYAEGEPGVSVGVCGIKGS